jgi:hypothetical protein
LEEQRSKLGKLGEYLGSTEAQIEAQRALEGEMEREIERAKELCVSLEAELGKVGLFNNINLKVIVRI